MRFHALDGWRGVSALLVLLFHIPVLTSLTVLPLVRNAFLFVDFFFVLGGFVITYAYDDRVGTRAGLAGFAIRRFGRLWPLHAVMLGAMIVLELAKLLVNESFEAGSHVPFTGQHSIPLIFANLALVQVARPEPLLSWNSPSWSISAEFWAYLLFAFVRSGFGRHSTAVAALIALGSGLMIWECSSRAMDLVAWLGFFRCLLGFFTGHLLFRLYRAAPLTRWPLFRNRRAATLLEAGAILAVVLFVSAAGQTQGAILAPLLFAAVVYLFAAEAGAISRLMKTRLFELLGRLSYSIYMVHAALFLAVIGAVHVAEKRWGLPLTQGFAAGGADIGDNAPIRFGGEGPMLLLTLLLVAGVVAASALTWRFIEMPGRRVFNRWAGAIESRGPRPGGAAESLAIPLPPAGVLPSSLEPPAPPSPAL